MVIVHCFESQWFVVVHALDLVARELEVGAAPFLSESGPVNLCAFYPDCGRDGAGGGVESFRRPLLEVFSYGFTPVDDGSEDLDTFRLRLREEGRSRLTSKSSAFGWGFWLSVSIFP